MGYEQFARFNAEVYTADKTGLTITAVYALKAQGTFFITQRGRVVAGLPAVNTCSGRAGFKAVTDNTSAR